MDWSTELLWWGLTRRIAWSAIVRRLVAVCAPEALHFPSVCIDDCYTTVEVAVRDINLIFCGVGEDFSDSSEVHFTEAAVLCAGFAELVKELTVPGKLQNLAIRSTVTADPYIIHVVNRDPVIRHRPHIFTCVRGSAPRTQ